jgi:hypothetical protein
MISVPNENILRLREITERLTREEKKDEYKIIVKQLKAIIDEGKNKIELSSSSESKIKCYETMCSTITNLLKNIKIK